MEVKASKTERHTLSLSLSLSVSAAALVIFTSFKKLRGACLYRILGSWFILLKFFNIIFLLGNITTKSKIF